MSGWLRYFVLKAQARSGLSGHIAIWAIVAVIAAAVAIGFLLVAAFIWLADRYSPLLASLALGCVFAVLALLALIVCLVERRRNMERARRELLARNSTASLLDPRLVAMGFQIGQSIGWRRLASLAAVALLAGGLAREWFGRQEAQAADEEPPSDG